MTLPAPEEQLWMIEPLLVAGLDLEQVRTLVFRLAFDALVGRDAAMLDLVDDQPAVVRAAWWHAIGRMISIDASELGS